MILCTIFLNVVMSSSARQIFAGGDRTLYRQVIILYTFTALIHDGCALPLFPQNEHNNSTTRPRHRSQTLRPSLCAPPCSDSPATHQDGAAPLAQLPNLPKPRQSSLRTDSRIQDETRTGSEQAVYAPAKAVWLTLRSKRDGRRGVRARFGELSFELLYLCLRLPLCWARARGLRRRVPLLLEGAFTLQGHVMRVGVWSIWGMCAEEVAAVRLRVPRDLGRTRVRVGCEGIGHGRGAHS